MESAIGFDLRSDVPDPFGPAASAGERYDLPGYDVAGYGLPGGLTNCGCTPEEAAWLAPAWAPLLSEWRLFGDPGHASRGPPLGASTRRIAPAVGDAHDGSSCAPATLGVRG